MKTTILLRQVTIGDDLRTLIEKKIKKLDKFFLENAEATVKLSKKREIEILEKENWSILNIQHQIIPNYRENYTTYDKNVFTIIAKQIKRAS